MKPVFQIGVVSFVVGMLACAGLFMFARTQGLDVGRITGDAKGYVILADHIKEFGVFSFSISAPFTPESFRVPGYPLFLAGLSALVGSWMWVLFLQAALMSVIPILVYILFRHHHERAAFWGAIVMVVEPVRLFLSSTFLSDAFFTLLFLVSLILIDRSVRLASWRYVFGAGIVLGVSMIVRPIALFLLFIYLAYLVWQMPHTRRLVLHVVLFGVGVLVVAGPWMLRNHTLFGTWSLSSVGAANLMLYNAPEFIQYAPTERNRMLLAGFRAEQSALHRDQALSLARSGVFTSQFREIIRGQELTYFIFHIAKTAPFFVSDGLRDTIRLFGVDIGPMPNISSALLVGNFGLLWSYLAGGGLPITLLVVGSGFWVLVCFLATWSIIQMLRRHEYSLAAFIAVPILYFALLTGPVSNARYRLPVEGLLLVAAAMVLKKEKA